MGRKKKPDPAPLVPEAPEPAPIQREIPVPPRDLVAKAVDEARKCGLRDPLRASSPKLQDYQTSFGFTVVISENEGHRRMGTVWFTAQGKITMWSLDGVPGL
jgi:hypothetical protein